MKRGFHILAFRKEKFYHYATINRGAALLRREKTRFPRSRRYATMKRRASHVGLSKSVAL